MNKSRENSISDSLTNPEIQRDHARAELLLFLGMFFLCWMAWNLWHDRGSVTTQEKSLALQWNGQSLQAVSSVLKTDVVRNTVPPPSVTPFLFQLLPVNLADAEQLTTLSGIGPELAARIVKTRAGRGPFLNQEDLRAVPGIGSERMKQFATQLSFQLP